MSATAIPRLETERLILRGPEARDLSALTAFFGSTQSQNVGGPLDEGGAALRLDAMAGHWQIKGYGSWVIQERATGAWMGRTGFLFYPGWAEPELGWALARVAEGRGIAEEATRAARSYGAANFGLDGVISYIRPGNARSRALAERLGATPEAEEEWRGAPVVIYRHPKEAAA